MEQTAPKSQSIRRSPKSQPLLQALILNLLLCWADLPNDTEKRWLKLCVIGNDKLRNQLVNPRMMGMDLRGHKEPFEDNNITENFSSPLPTKTSRDASPH